MDGEGSNKLLGPFEGAGKELGGRSWMWIMMGWMGWMRDQIWTGGQEGTTRIKGEG